MFNRHPDVIGNWGPQYGYGSTGPGPNALTAFGQAVDPNGFDPSQAQAMQQQGWGPPVGYPGGYPGVAPGFPGGGGPWGGIAGGFAGGPWGPWCGGPPAQFSNVFEPKRIPAVALGSACGPLALRKPLGFECDTLPACSTRTFKATPQEWYKIERLIINPAIACSIVIRGLTVGIQNMLSDCGGCLPGAMFGPEATDMFLNGFTAFPGQDICLVVENVTEQDLCFSAGLLGSVLSGGFPHLYGTADP